MTGVGASAPLGNQSGETLFDFENWVRQAPSMLHLTDAAGRLVSVSEAWLAKLGYSREEAVGRRISDFLAPEFAGPVGLGNGEDLAAQMVAKDGRFIDVLSSGVLDQDSGAPQGLAVTAIVDVTAMKEAQRKLAAGASQYRSLVENQVELVSLATVEGEFLYVNEAHARHFGKRAEEIVGKSIFDFQLEEGRVKLKEHLRRVCEARGSLTNENQVVLPNGEVRWTSWTNRALRDEFGEVTAIHSVGRDIEPIVEAERRLKESEARYRLLAEHSTDMVLELDADLRRRYVSPACREIFGFEPEELIGGTTGVMSHPEDSERLADALQALLDGRADRETVVSRRRHRDGRWIWVETRYRAVRDAQSGATTGIIASVRDISERKAVEDRLAEANQLLEAAAREDGLTGLANRRTFDDALASAYGRAQGDNRNLSLIMIDVDGFKPFNDRYGHPAGDECLRRIGKTLAGALLRPGDLAARYGGEEFALLLPDTDELSAAVIAEQIRRTVMQMEIKHEGAARRIMTVSAGVAAIGRRAHEGGPAALVQSADRALYRAKRGGRNAVVLASTSHAAGLISPDAA
ncbi:MAG TPA: PAS domain S-box protein [Roseiarcus sp.]